MIKSARVFARNKVTKQSTHSRLLRLRLAMTDGVTSAAFGVDAQRARHCEEQRDEAICAQLGLATYYNSIFRGIK